MKDSIRYSLLVILIFTTGVLCRTAASGNPLQESNDGAFDKEAAIREIKSQLAAMATKSLMDLGEFCKKNTIQGEFVIDLTVAGKGKVLTVFMVSGGEGNIREKNLLKDKLKELQFDNVKIPKNERVKLRHTLNL